jgi:transcriptional regulator with XRE-family HTH domain
MHGDPFATAYRMPMGDGDGLETWADYLRRMTNRPGWSVARLARESGIHRATIFKWLAGKGGVNVASVRAVAAALGDDPANALRAAGNVGGQDNKMDPDLLYLMRRLADPDVPESEKTSIRAALRYLAELSEQAERPGRVIRRRAG